ncbi:MAG: hypothetical protein ABH852_00300 [Methanobacteriota archaeon]
MSSSKFIGIIVIISVVVVGGLLASGLLKLSLGQDGGEEQETQANAYQALFNTMDRHPDVVRGAFLWDVNMATEQVYQQGFAKMRTFNIRGKISEDIVRGQYAQWVDQP